MRFRAISCAISLWLRPLAFLRSWAAVGRNCGWWNENIERTGGFFWFFLRCSASASSRSASILRTLLSWGVFARPERREWGYFERTSDEHTWSNICVTAQELVWHEIIFTVAHFNVGTLEIYEKYRFERSCENEKMNGNRTKRRLWSWRLAYFEKVSDCFTSRNTILHSFLIGNDQDLNISDRQFRVDSGVFKCCSFAVEVVDQITLCCVCSEWSTLSVIFIFQLSEGDGWP